MTTKAIRAINPRSRIIETRRIRAEDIAPHPGNWRDHPTGQAEAMAGVMREVGDVGVLLAWNSERNGGKLTLIDGHLRRGLAPDHEYMVAVTDLSDAEADYVLATHDPLAAMAQADAAALDALLSSVNSGEAAVEAMLADMADRITLPSDDEWGNGFGGAPTDDRAPFQQMTFTLHDTQAEQVKKAITAASKLGDFADSQNKNSNGNALAFICETFVTAYGNG